MAETTEEKLDRITREQQDLLRRMDPEIDVEVGSMQYELIAKPLGVLITNQEIALETDIANRSIAQVLSSDAPDPDSVDQLLSNYNVTRRLGTLASGSAAIFTKSTSNLFISGASTLVCGATTLRPVKNYVGVIGDITDVDTAGTSYIQMRQFDAGTYVFNITVETVDPFDGVIDVGQACSFANANPQVSSVTIASTITGGIIQESTESLLDRASVGIHARVLTGKDNIRSLMQDNVILDVLDSTVFGFGDTLMLRDQSNPAGLSQGASVDVYVRTNPIPPTATDTLPATIDSAGVWTMEIPAEAYPGAYGVLAVRSEGLTVDSDITPILSFFTEDNAPRMSKTIHARYSKYQLLSVQFSSSKLEATAGTTQSFEVDILYMPGLLDLQDLMNDDNVRNYAFDTLVKGAIPVSISVDYGIKYVQGVIAPEVEEVQQQVADIINGKLIGQELLQSSDVVYASKIIFPAGEVQMPINMNAKVWLPDGTEAITFTQSYVKVMEAAGISFENAMFFTTPTQVNVTLTEIPA